MLTRVLYILLSTMWRHPPAIVSGVILLCVASVAVSAGGSVLTRHRSGSHASQVAGWRLAVTLAVFSVADWLLLWSLPRLRLSFSTDIALPLVPSIIVRLIVFWSLLCVALGARWLNQRRGVQKPVRSLVGFFLVVNVLFSAAQIDAYVVEPLLVETTRLSLAAGDLDPSIPPVRVVQLTDMHIERNSFREGNVVRRVNALQPDIIVLTGDYLNLSRLSDPRSVADFRAFVSRLEAPHGIFAVRGSVEPSAESMARLVLGTDIVWLEQQAVTVNVRGQEVTIVGVACSHRQEVDSARLARAMVNVPDDAFTLLLYHSPDLIKEATRLGVDLYLGGHTHGGQLRLPFYGALASGSVYGKQYVSGLFEEGSTRMYISRGVGFEGGGMPRARFLCRPEIVSLEIGGSTGT